MIREIIQSDIQEILAVRTSTVENHFSLDELANIGITEKTVSDWLEGSIKGWVFEISGKIVGFAMGDSKTAEILVIAISPGYEKLGIGKRLMHTIQDWLWSFDHQTLWLWSNPDISVRAHGFYRKLGWKPTGEVMGNNEKLVLRRNSGHL